MKHGLREASYEDTKPARYSVEYYSPKYNDMRHSLFNDERQAFDYFNEKRSEGYKKLKLIKTETVTITTEYMV